ncbi:hypothetical protein [Streptomyces thermoalcalitolerans]|uniref:Uncharacterized protein n=1 Tax=Streptomyces thermoalcalitolerans TaxID=65605 RepID=A0ABN1NB85_9ACTN
MCTTEGGARTLARVRVDFAVREGESVDRTARVFARRRQSLCGDHGHAEALAPAEMSAELDWWPTGAPASRRHSYKTRGVRCRHRPVHGT